MVKTKAETNPSILVLSDFDGTIAETNPSILVLSDFDGTMTKRPGSALVFSDFYQSLLEGHVEGIEQDYKSTPMISEAAIIQKFEDKFGKYSDKSYNTMLNNEHADIDILVTPDALAFLKKQLDNYPDVEITFVTKNRAPYLQALLKYQGLTDEQLSKIKIKDSSKGKDYNVQEDLHERYPELKKEEEVTEPPKRIYVLDDSPRDRQDMEKAVTASFPQVDLKSHTETPGQFQWNTYSEQIESISNSNVQTENAQATETQESTQAIDKSKKTNPYNEADEATKWLNDIYKEKFGDELNFQVNLATLPELSEFKNYQYGSLLLSNDKEALEKVKQNLKTVFKNYGIEVKVGNSKLPKQVGEYFIFVSNVDTVQQAVKAQKQVDQRKNTKKVEERKRAKEDRRHRRQVRDEQPQEKNKAEDYLGSAKTQRALKEEVKQTKKPETKDLQEQPPEEQKSEEIKEADRVGVWLDDFYKRNLRETLGLQYHETNTGETVFVSPASDKKTAEKIKLNLETLFKHYQLQTAQVGIRESASYEGQFRATVSNANTAWQEYNEKIKQVEETMAWFDNFYKKETGKPVVTHGDLKKAGKLSVVSEPSSKDKAVAIKNDFEMLFKKLGIKAEVGVRESASNKGQFRAFVNNADEIRQKVIAAQKAQAKPLYWKLSTTASGNLQTEIDKLKNDIADISSDDLQTKAAMQTVHENCVDILQESSNKKSALEDINSEIERAAGQVDPGWREYLKNFAKKMNEAILGVFKQKDSAASQTPEAPDPDEQGPSSRNKGPGAG